MDGIRLRSVGPARLKRQSPGPEGGREGSSSCRGLAFWGGFLTVFYDLGLVPNDEAGGCMRMDSVPRRIWLLSGARGQPPTPLRWQIYAHTTPRDLPSLLSALSVLQPWIPSVPALK